MKHVSKRILSLLLTLVLAISLVTPALGVDLDADATVQDAVKALLEDSGLTAEQLGDYPADYNALAESLGMIEDKDDQDALDAAVTDAQLAEMEAIAGRLKEAVNADALVPYFENGLAQPIFPYTSGCVSTEDFSGVGGDPASEEAYSNANSDIIRYMVYVETNYDTDGDGKLDLVKALVQVPRSAAEGNYKAATIFEARPYITGCTPLYGDADGYVDGATFDVDSLYSQPDPREPAGDPVGTMEFAAEADSNDWYYWNPYEDMYDYEDLTWYDYFLVRGYAVVESGGIGTRDSEGFETCGTDLEIDAFKCIVEWLNGERVAYTDKTSNIPIEADWSAGSVGTTGRSYAGTTQFGLATTGVAGLKTVVPVAGISSWYEYTNAQGISTRRSPNYVDMLAMYCAGRYLDDEDWNQLFPTYGSYMYQLKQDQLSHAGDYAGAGDDNTWSSRDYTLNWANIKIPALIVHGVNDYNVRTKMSDQMYQAFTKAGQDVKFIFHQDGHLTPAYPAGELEFEVGGRMYDEILNQWFTHYLYGQDNGAEDLPAVLAQNNDDPDSWTEYDNWEAAEDLVLNGTSDSDVTISSDYAGIGVSNQNWQSVFTTDSTASSAMFVSDVEQDTVVKGAVAVSFTASVSNVDKDDAPRGAAVDHDSYVDPATFGLDHDNFAGVLGSTGGNIAIPDAELIDRDSLMVSAMLVDLNGGETFPTCNTAGCYVPKTVLAEDGVWMGGGVDKFDFVKLNPTDVTYKIVARGWMDLCNPDAGYDSASASTRVALQEGQSHDYTIYLQPNVYRIPAGHQLAVVIYPYEPSMATYTQNYAITLEKDSVVATVPVDTGAATQDAPYQDDSVQLTVTAGRNGTVQQTVANGPVQPGTEVTVTATAADGFQFDGWTVNGQAAGTDASLTLTIDKDTGVSAAFSRITQQVAFTVNEAENGTVTQSVENGQVAVGTQVTLTAEANSGYSFDGWTVNGQAAGTDETLTLTVNEDTTVDTSFSRHTGGGGGGGAGAATMFTVTTTSSDNGTINVSATRVASGATVTVTLAPADGYTVSSFSVKDAKGNDVTVTDAGENKCTFRMPNANVTVSAVFAVPAETPTSDGQGMPFMDVNDTAWFYDDVAYVYEKGLMNGTGETTFEPSLSTTRGMIVTILYRLENEPAVTGENPFEDVAAGSYCDAAVNWAAANGIVNGTTETTFAPNDFITREQMATILYRYAEFKGLPVSATADLSAFSDADQVSGYAKDAMAWTVGVGLLEGGSNGNLLPKGTATRAQVAAVLHRAAGALQLLGQ